MNHIRFTYSWYSFVLGVNNLCVCARAIVNENEIPPTPTICHLILLKRHPRAVDLIAGGGGRGALFYLTQSLKYARINFLFIGFVTDNETMQIGSLILR